MMITNSDELALHLDRHWGRCEAETANEVELDRINEVIGKYGSTGLCIRLFRKKGRSYVKHDDFKRKTDGVYLSHCIPDYDDCPKPVYLAFPFTTQELSTAVDDICNRATALWEELSENDTDDDYDDRDGDNLFRDTLRYP